MNDSTLSRIVRIITQAVDPDSIILFGSRATGNEDTESGYDICVLKSGVLGAKTVKLYWRREWKEREGGLISHCRLGSSGT